MLSPSKPWCLVRLEHDVLPGEGLQHGACWVALLCVPLACSPEALDTPMSGNLAPAPASSWDGFAVLPPANFELGASTRVEVQLPEARLFHRFVPASGPAGTERLCVVFNGGPGIGSQGLWLQLGPDSGSPLTSLCHALFVDARNAGLSYEIVDEPESYVASHAEYNAYMDAVDMLRLLALLAPRLPEIREALLVGESYGGVRASLMLDLMRSTAEDELRPLRSLALARELRSLERRWGVPPSALFNRQLLIQPTLMGTRQDEWVGKLMLRPDSVLRQLGAELGYSFRECLPADCDAFEWMLSALADLGRSPYDYRAPVDWLEQQLQAASSHVFGRDGLLERLAVKPPWGLPAADRLGGFRISDEEGLPADPQNWSRVLGSLGPHDRYYIPFNTDVYDLATSDQAQALGVDAFSPAIGEAFLQNLRTTHTLITQAKYDLVNHSPAIIESLRTLSTVADVAVGREHWRIQTTDGNEWSIFSPSYESSHAVARDAAPELLLDVRQWLEE